ncbi:MAG: anti-sigma factor domain-containing protein [Polaromonas sp.]
MSTLDFKDPLSRNQIAGEYVLGTLSAASRREVERRLPLDDALRTDVYSWQENLLPLAALASPVQPSAQLWQRIAGSVQGVAATSMAAEPSPPVQPRRAVKPSALQSRWTNWWDSLNLWRGLAGSGFAAAAVLAAVLVTRMGAAPAPQYLVVLVAPQDKSPGWVVQASAQDAGRQISLIPLGRDTVPAEKTLQFWTKGDNWNGPVSLGLVQPGQTIKIPLDKLPPLQPNQLFELTLEPSGGSPIGKPTGPIQFIGRAVKVT